MERVNHLPSLKRREVRSRKRNLTVTMKELLSNMTKPKGIKMWTNKKMDIKTETKG